MEANDVNEFYNINIVRWKNIIIIKNLISPFQYRRLMIPISYISIDIYLNLISHFRYERLLISMDHIGINIYLNLISRFRYGRLMIPMRFIGINMNMKGYVEMNLINRSWKIKKANDVNVYWYWHVYENLISYPI